MNNHKKFRWSFLSLIVLIILPVVAFAAPVPPTPLPPIPKVEPEVLAEINTKGQSSFWVILNEQADLSPAYAIQDWEARGRYVVEQLRATAESNQAGLHTLLQKRGVSHEPHWLVNAIRVTGGRPILEELAADVQVGLIVPDQVYQIPQPEPGATEATIQSIEWNIDRIRAPEVWAGFGVQGEGIVVANIDTGVQFDHPALVNQYRGNLGNGSFDHNYNWYDPANICGNPSLVPCDNNDHGTHTMGTMVGNDGGGNQIGVAPGATWIAAKGCELDTCSTSSLLAAGEWLLAPTDLNGQNPRPDLRPHIINNSWGGSSGNTFYQATVDAWLAAGIFPAFSNGNDGPGCGTAGSPGDFVNTYSAGAFDIDNAIASFSSRGASAFGGIKPNIAAPGVSVRSSVVGNAYASFSGTSMASPHVAGTVALLWSAEPALIGDIDGTRALLDQTAIDTSDLSCGGTAENNNVWGEGRLDAFLAVDQATLGTPGTLQGTVVDAVTGNPLAGVPVSVTGAATLSTVSDAAGQYSMRLLGGIYELTADAIFGYTGQAISGVVVTEGQITTQDIPLTPLPAHPVSGRLTDNNGNPLANIPVNILNTPISPVTTDANGDYSFTSVPEGSYTIEAAAYCNETATQAVVVDSPQTVNFALSQKIDEFGYTCQIVPPAFVPGDTLLSFAGSPNYVSVDLPFSFSYYGTSYQSIWVYIDGLTNFTTPTTGTGYSGGIPSIGVPQTTIAPFWDDLAPVLSDPTSGVYTAVRGTAPNREFVIEWRNMIIMQDFDPGNKYVDFGLILKENGDIEMQYRNIDDNGRERGNSATIGIENETGLVGLQYAVNKVSLASPEHAILFEAPAVPLPTPTPTSTAVPPTPTSTAVPPTPTSTAIPPTPTSTPLPPSPTPPPTGGELVYVSSTSGGNAGGVAFADEDILAYDAGSGTWSMVLDGSDVGLGSSNGQDVDAFTMMGDGSILLSFVARTSIPGIGNIDDSDIVRFIPTSLGNNTAGSFAMYFDGSDVGLTTSGEDVDAIGFTPDGALLLSTSGNYNVGLSGGDEDLLRFDATSLGSNTSGTFSLYFDGSDVALTNSSEDVYGAWIAGNGDIYLTTLGTFAVSGANGDGADVLLCASPTIGNNTSCSFSLYWDGLVNGFGGEVMDGLYIERP